MPYFQKGRLKLKKIDGFITIANVTSMYMTCYCNISSAKACKLFTGGRGRLSHLGCSRRNFRNVFGIKISLRVAPQVFYGEL